MTTSTRDKIYTYLKEEIMNARLLPGTALSEKEIGERFAVSRTPVREALLRLSQEELVEIYPQRGTIVALIDLERMEEGRFMREHLEVAVIKEAASAGLPEVLMLQLEANVKTQHLYMEQDNAEKLYLLDQEFHAMIFAGCGKVRTWSAIQQMNIQFNRVRLLSLNISQDSSEIIKQHQSIIELIRSKDAEGAVELMHKHLTRVTLHKEKLKQDYPASFK